MEKIFPNLWLRKPRAPDMAIYQKPFEQESARQVLWQYILDMPKGGGRPVRVAQLMQRYSNWLKRSKVPKLLMYAMPGFFMPIATAMWCKKHLTNLEVVDIGEAMHFAQETNPKVFAAVLSEWYAHIERQAESMRKEREVALVD